MKTSIFFICLFLGLNSPLNAQNQIDDIGLAKMYLDSVDVLIKQKKYEDAIYLNESAINIYERFAQAEDSLVINAYSKFASIFLRKSDFNKAIEMYQKVLDLRVIFLGAIHSDVAETYNFIGGAYNNKGDYKKALDYFNKGLETKIKASKEENEELIGFYHNVGHASWMTGKYIDALNNYDKELELISNFLGEDHSWLTNVYNNISNVHHDMGNYKTAIEYQEKVIDISRKKPSGDNITIAYAYNRLGVFYETMGNYTLSIQYGEKALQMAIDILGADHPDISQYTHNAGLPYQSKGDYYKALQYYEKTLANDRNHLGEDHPVMAATYSKIGGVFESLQNYDKALYYNEKALDLDLNAYGRNHTYVASSYNNSANVYSSMGNYPKAMEYHEEALDIRLTVFGKENHKTAISYYNMGNVYMKMQRYEEAFHHFQESYAIWGKIFNNKGPYVATSLYGLGKTKLRTRDTLSAIEYLQKGIETSGININEKPISAIEFSPGLFEALAHLIDAKSNYDIPNIPKSLDLVQRTDEIVNYFNQQLSEGASRVEFQEQCYMVYEASIRGFQTKSLRNKTQEFEIAERSKSTVLLSEVRNNYTEAYNDLPGHLQNKDYQLKLEIAQYEKQRFDEEQKKESKNDSLVAAYNSEVFKLKRQHEKLVTTFKNNYPNYYQLKYDNSTASVKEVQSLLETDQALIEYFIGDDAVYIFSLTANEYEVNTIKKDFPLEEWVSQVRDGIYLSTMNNHFDSSQIDSLKQQYADAAYQLHEKLIAPIPLELPKRLIIVPDGALGYLPFDALLSSKPADIGQFKSYDYLLRTYAICYNYSATLYQQILEQPKSRASKRLLAVAPNFGQDRSANYIAGRSIDELRDTLLPLRYNVLEVAYLHDLIGGDTLVGNNAILELFKNQAKDYQIVHLSTHGKANDKIGNYSYLAFTETKDSIENEKLYVRELYNLKLNADMVVLSACETGLGELKRGEGIIGMARGFLYAGTKSIITTLWSVNDKSTQEFMQHFYDGIKAEQSKDIAMQEAKLKLLESNYPEPFYWAGFTAIGDMTSLGLRGGFRWWYFLVIPLGLFLLIRLSRRRSTT